MFFQHRHALGKVALRKESVDRNLLDPGFQCFQLASLSARRAWIEMKQVVQTRDPAPVALRKESVDRNCKCEKRMGSCEVALRKESVDRNVYGAKATQHIDASLSARRAWIEMIQYSTCFLVLWSLSARRAWIEMSVGRNVT